MNRELGHPEAELRIMVDGDEVAVCAWFINTPMGMDIVVGVQDTSAVGALIKLLGSAAQALNDANWKQVADMDASVVDWDAPDFPLIWMPDEEEGATRGGDTSKTDYPF